MDYAVVRNEDGVLKTSSGNSPQMLRGMSALVQAVVIELCSKPLPPQGGSGFVFGLFTDPVGSPEAEQNASMRLHNARQNILAYQRDANLPADEQLSNLHLMGLRPTETGWEVDIQVTNAQGEEAVVTI